MTRPARRHHLVSKFYLDHFADDDGMIATVMLPGDRRFTQNVGNATVQKDFFTAVDTKGQQTDVAERAFSEIEAPAAQAWQSIAAGMWPLPEAERGAVAAWAALHLLRVGGHRHQMQQMATELLNLQVLVGGRARLRQVLREDGLPHDNNAVDLEWIARVASPLLVDVHANHHLEYISQTLPKVTAMLLERWWVLTTFQRRGLATSDHPVFVVPNEKDRARGFGTGIANAAEIVLPLTRRHSVSMALRGSDLGPLPRTDCAEPGVTVYAQFSNSCAVRNSRRVVFHHPADNPLKGISLPEPRTSELSAGDLWRFIPEQDRQILADAGVQPVALDEDDGKA